VEPYVRAVLAHPVIVGLIMLVALGGSLAWLSHRATNYQATADILFTAVPSGNQDINGLPVLRESSDPTRLTQTAASLLDTPRAAQLAAESMGAGWTPAKIHQAIVVQPQGQSDIIAVTATANSAALAQRLANAFANTSLQARRALLRSQASALGLTAKANIPPGEFAAQQRQALAASLLRGVDPNFSLSQAATLPSSPTGTSKWLVMILALLAGFALGSGTAIVMEMVNDRVRASDELVGLYGLPILAYIPMLPRRTRASVNGGPAPVPPAVREAFQMIRVQLDTAVSNVHRSHGRAILLTSGSSGDGKTTSAINIATALADAGHRVILMDLDLRKPDLGRLLHLERAVGVTALNDSSTELPLVPIVPASNTHAPLLSILPAGSEANESMLGPVVTHLPSVLEKARRQADYIVIDAPPLGEVSDAYQILPLVDEIIVVGRPGNTRRASFEFMRELLGRANRTPLGMVVIGETPHRSSYYYGQSQTNEPRMGAWLRSPPATSSHDS
jgi:Mrp family chromosome partitioning ATPase/capsular polysaccharide biosynthesis protein